MTLDELDFEIETIVAEINQHVMQENEIAKLRKEKQAKLTALHIQRREIIRKVMFP